MLLKTWLVLNVYSKNTADKKYLKHGNLKCVYFVHMRAGAPVEPISTKFSNPRHLTDAVVRSFVEKFVLISFALERCPLHKEQQLVLHMCSRAGARVYRSVAYLGYEKGGPIRGLETEVPQRGLGLYPSHQRFFEILRQTQSILKHPLENTKLASNIEYTDSGVCRI